MTRETLIQNFKQFGEIQTAFVVYDDDGRSRCFGYVRFTTVSACKRALAAENMFVEGRCLVIKAYDVNKGTQPAKKLIEPKSKCCICLCAKPVIGLFPCKHVPFCIGCHQHWTRNQMQSLQCPI